MRLTLALAIALSPGIAWLILRYWRFHAELLIVALAVLPIVPDATDPRSIAFLALAVLGVLAAGGRLLGATLPFVTLVCLAVAWSPSIGAWGRGAIPFAFLLLAGTWVDIRSRRVIGALIVAGSVLAVRGLVAFLQTRSRITLASLDFILPLPILGVLGCLALLVYEPWPLRRWRGVLIACLVVQGAHIVMTATFGYIAASTVAVLVLLRPAFTQGKRVKRVLGAAAVILAAAALAGPAITQPLLQRARLGGAETSSAGRVAEVGAALEEWRVSPLIGRGLGHQYHSPITGDGTAVTYVHNVVAYLLMTLGLAGLIAYGIVVTRIWWLARGASLVPTFVRSALVALATLGLSSAVFRSVQFNCLLALLLALARHSQSNTTRATEGAEGAGSRSPSSGRTQFARTRGKGLAATSPSPS